MMLAVFLFTLNLFDWLDNYILTSLSIARLEYRQIYKSSRRQASLSVHKGLGVGFFKGTEIRMRPYLLTFVVDFGLYRR